MTWTHGTVSHTSCSKPSSGPRLHPGSSKAFTPDLFSLVCHGIPYLTLTIISGVEGPLDLLPHSCLSYLQACVPKATAQHHSPES